MNISHCTCLIEIENIYTDESVGPLKIEFQSGFENRFLVPKNEAPLIL